MTTGHYEDKDGSNWGIDPRAANDTSTAHSMDPSISPGKSSPTTRAAVAGAQGIDNDYVKNGAVGDRNPEADGVFLDADQRKRLIDQYVARVGRAEIQYLDALTSIRIDELMKHDDSDIGWVMGTIIAIVTGYIGVLAGGVFKAIMGWNTAQRAAELAAIGPTRPIAAAFAGEKQTDGIMSAVSGTARAYALMGASAEKAALATDPHARVLSFVEQLKSAATTLFRRLAEDPQAMANDVNMVALWKAMEDEAHTSDKYKRKLLEKIEAYKASRASWVGERIDTGEGENAPPNGAPVVRHFENGDRQAWTLTTKVAWMSLLSGREPLRLWYFDDRKTAGNRGWDQINRRPYNAEYELVSPVEDDFVEIAIERHTQAFGAKPGAMVIDDRDLSEIRIVVDPFKGLGPPKLQLGAKP